VGNDFVTKNTVRIDKEMARIDWHVAPKLQDVIDTIEEIVQGSRFHSDLQLLVVDHATDLNVYAPEIRDAVEVLAPHVKRFLSVAYWVRTDIQYGIAKQFRADFLLAGVAVEVSRDEMTEGTWLLAQ
jgi:hypothetical protein